VTRLVITNNSNDRLKAMRRLRRRGGRADGVFVVDGYRQLLRAVDAGAVVREVYAAPELFLGADDAALLRRARRAGARVCELSGPAFRSISSNVRPDGLAAVVERWPIALPADAGEWPLLLVCDSIERPGNLGALIRTACAAGATGLISCDAATDIFHPEAVRGSVGTLFDVHVSESRAARAVPWLRRHAVAIAVASPSGRTPYWEVDWTGSTAVVVGSERHGVSNAWLAAADTTVRIPMPGFADSLNVAVAAGIVLFEAARQRARPTRASHGSRQRPSLISGTGPVRAT
jgi:TrmH family RNA methyltransferase